MGCVCHRIKEKKNAKVPKIIEIDKYDNLAELTEQQKCVIRSNWKVLKSEVENVGVITFVSMFENRPDLKDVFSSFKGKDLTDLQNSGLIRVHALRVMATVDKCVSRIDEQENYGNILRQLGHHHREYQVKKEHMQSMLPAFIQAIKPHIENEWSDEVELAWHTFFSLIIDYIGEGINDNDYKCVS